MTDTKKPNIGILLDWEDDGGYSKLPYFALKSNYVDAVRIAGGLPWMIPYAKISDVRHYLDQVDGLVIPGGFYAMPDEWYVDLDNASPYKKTPRFEFEKAILTESLNRDMPTVGICGGMQVMSGIMGCKLIGDITKYYKSDIKHLEYKQEHLVEVKEGSILHRIVQGKSKFLVNSNHKEAVIEVSNSVIVSAKSTDGVIEAIEISSKKFAIGLQWHPEAMCSSDEQLKEFNPHHLIFKELINNASGNK